MLNIHESVVASTPKTQTWSHKTADNATADDAQIREMGWQSAQQWCNFVLHLPRVLPDQLAFESTGWIRPEAPPGRPNGLNTTGRSPWGIANRCSHYVRLFSTSAVVRIKQFLYDWAPPAWDHPSLWKNAPRGFPLGNSSAAILWIGMDYKGNQAASVTMNRTTIEISLEKGICADDFLIELVTGLQPVVPSIATQILQTPVGELMYQRRHVVQDVDTPLSYWNYTRSGTRDVIVLTRLDREFPLAIQDYSVPAIDGFEADTILVFGDRSTPDETEVIYVPRDCQYGLVRLLRGRGIPYPPSRYEKQPCKMQVESIGRRSIYHAFLTEAFGQHEAVWSTDGFNSLLLIQPSKITSESWFKRFLRNFEGIHDDDHRLARLDGGSGRPRD